MPTLILTIAGDTHSHALGWALRARGEEVQPVYVSDHPADGSSTLEIWDGKASISIHGADTRFDSVKTTGPWTIWNRRLGVPTPADDLHPSDHALAKEETTAHWRGIFHTLNNKDNFWVNGPSAKLRAEIKAIQLQEAAKVGFSVPPTLMSDSPQHIRDFASRHSGRLVMKAHVPHAWLSKDGVAMAFTSLITEKDLADDEALSLCPAIFQPYVEKEFEIRVTIMGRSLFAAKLCSQDSDDGKLDWRVDQGQGFAIKPFKVSEELRTKCLALMDNLGLLFGCLDLIVTPSGDIVFLEINQAGQFLWVEQHCPEIPLLQAMSAFRTSRDPGFRFQEVEDTRLSYARFASSDEARHYSERDKQAHRSAKMQNMADETGPHDVTATVAAPA